MNRTALILFTLLTSIAHADRALIVGINDYEHVEPLGASVSDARVMARFVQDMWHFDAADVRFLANPAGAELVAAIETWLIDGTVPGDRALFYYAGHGAQIKDFDGDEQDGLDEVIVGRDAHIDEQGRAVGFVTDDQLHELMDRLQGRGTTVIVDSCNSGTITRSFSAGRSARAIPRTPPELARVMQASELNRARDIHRAEEAWLPEAPGRIVWTAASSYQDAFESHPESGAPFGIFTHSFISGIRSKAADRNGNGVIVNAELLDYLRDVSASFCEQAPECQHGLTPTLAADRALLAAPAEPIRPPGATEATPAPDDGSSSAPTEPSPSIEPTPASEPDAAELPELASDVLGHGNNAEVQIELLPSSKVNLGDRVSFRVTSGRDGYLILLDIDAASKLRQLYPNRFADQAGKGNEIAADRAITIPDIYYGFEFRAREPAGKGLLLAIVTEDDVELEQLLAQSRDLQVVATPRDYLLELAESPPLSISYFLCPLLQLP